MFNKDFYFHWADSNNEPLNNWKDIAQYLLSIPMAHQLIGFYTVADDTDGILKVMRSYQYYAASRITGRVAMRRWADKDPYGGYIWHTTGSGKTLTSFKSAQLDCRLKRRRQSGIPDGPRGAWNAVSDGLSRICR